MSNKQKEIDFFNQQADTWNDNIKKESIDIAREVIRRFQIGNYNSVLDIGAGTGILYSILKDTNLTNYLAIDIAEKMIEKFQELYPEVDARQADYENEYFLDIKFDFIIIFDSIPHFKNLDIVFSNSYNNLKYGGKFIIVHSKTREALRKHHHKIGYKSLNEPIPGDKKLITLSKKYGFTNIEIQDNNYFLYMGEKK